MGKKKAKKVKLAFGVAVGDNGYADYTEQLVNPTKDQLKRLETLSDFPNAHEFEGCTAVEISIFEIEVTPPVAKKAKTKKLKAKKIVHVEQEQPEEGSSNGDENN